MFDPIDMITDYEIMSKQRLELFNLLVKVNIGWINKEDIILPINLIEKQYNALAEYTTSLGQCLNLLGVELPDID